jgi:hypothetical protein
MGNNFSKREILDRIKQRYNLVNNTELSKFLGISPSTLSNWYTRNSIDFDIIFTKCEHLNLNWLLTGKGSMLIDDNQQPPDEHLIEESKPVFISPPECERCRMKDEVIAILRHQVETQDKLIDYLEDKKSPHEDGQKRKAAS